MTTSQTHIDKYFDFQPRTFAKFASKRLAAAIPGAAHPGNEPQAQQPHLHGVSIAIVYSPHQCLQHYGYIHYASSYVRWCRAATGAHALRGGAAVAAAAAAAAARDKESALALPWKPTVTKTKLCKGEGRAYFYIIYFGAIFRHRLNSFSVICQSCTGHNS